MQAIPIAATMRLRICIIERQKTIPPRLARPSLDRSRRPTVLRTTLQRISIAVTYVARCLVHPSLVAVFEAAKYARWTSLH